MAFESDGSLDTKRGRAERLAAGAALLVLLLKVDVLSTGLGAGAGPGVVLAGGRARTTSDARRWVVAGLRIAGLEGSVR